MKYADIVNIFDEIYFESDKREMDYLVKWVDALHEGNDKTADFYRRRADVHHYKSKGMEEFFGRIEKLAKQSGEDVDV